MTEYAANFTTTFHDKPSILEIIAQSSLNDALQPALRKLLGSINPASKHYLWYKYNDTAIIVIDTLLQYYYLKNFDGLFSENFYGLKRVFSNGDNLGNKYKVFLAIHSALTSFLKGKFDEKYDSYRNEEFEGVLDQESYTNKLKVLFVRLYPFVKSAWGSILIYNYLRFLKNKVNSHSPVFGLLNLKLVRYFDDNESGWNFLTNGLSWDCCHKDVVRNLMISSLESIAFFLQFANALESIVPNFNTRALPKISPPMADFKSDQFRDKCPICKQYWKLPAVLPVSGYVFCLTCILRHLSEERCCPITKLPAKPLDVIRIFNED